MNFDQRKKRANFILEKYKNSVPIIVTASKKTKFSIKRNQFIVSKDSRFLDFYRMIVPYIDNLDPDQTFFMFVNGNYIPSYSMYISEIYDHYKNDDGFLYVTYIEENTFG